jgi:hypothetical protein
MVDVNPNLNVAAFWQPGPAVCVVLAASRREPDEIADLRQRDGRALVAKRRLVLIA